jgi:hypothetical protein
LAGTVVVAPYASALALAVAPAQAAANLRALGAARRRGLYGLFEAVDFHTRARPEGERFCAGRRLDGAPPGNDPVRDRQRAHDDALVRRFACAIRACGSSSCC